LAAEALNVPEGVLVNDADQTEKFEERVLKWRCSQKQFIEWGEGVLDRISNLVCRLIDITEPVSFINNGEVPSDLA
jgi:hypothetical protein